MAIAFLMTSFKGNLIKNDLGWNNSGKCRLLDHGFHEPTQQYVSFHMFHRITLVHMLCFSCHLLKNTSMKCWSRAGLDRVV